MCDGKCQSCHPIEITESINLRDKKYRWLCCVEIVIGSFSLTMFSSKHNQTKHVWNEHSLKWIDLCNSWSSMHMHKNRNIISSVVTVARSNLMLYNMKWIVEQLIVRLYEASHLVMFVSFSWRCLLNFNGYPKRIHISISLSLWIVFGREKWTQIEAKRDDEEEEKKLAQFRMNAYFVWWIAAVDDDISTWVVCKLSRLIHQTRDTYAYIENSLGNKTNKPT